MGVSIMRRPDSDRSARPVEGESVLAVDESAGLRAANLSAPGFRETWLAGSPLNWCEFIASWQAIPPGDASTRDERSNEAVEK
jgi:hypothetical protein